MKYVRELSEKEQEELLEKEKKHLIKEGYNEREIQAALSDAMDSKVSDLRK